METYDNPQKFDDYQEYLSSLADFRNALTLLIDLGLRGLYTPAKERKEAIAVIEQTIDDATENEYKIAKDYINNYREPD